MLRAQIPSSKQNGGRICLVNDRTCGGGGGYLQGSGHRRVLDECVAKTATYGTECRGEKFL